jgi:hypothetical protein
MLLVGFYHACSWEVGGSEVKNGLLNTLEAEIVMEASHSAPDNTHLSSKRKMVDEVLKRERQAAPSWDQRDDANLVGTSDFDKFGASSSLSANGLVLAVGAP